MKCGKSLTQRRCTGKSICYHSGYENACEDEINETMHLDSPVQYCHTESLSSLYFYFPNPPAQPHQANLSELLLVSPGLCVSACVCAHMCECVCVWPSPRSLLGHLKRTCREHTRKGAVYHLPGTNGAVSITSSQGFNHPRFQVGGSVPQAPHRSSSSSWGAEQG